MQRLKYKFIAIDFDGTIATDSYPNIGTMLKNANRVIRKIKNHGGQVSIWTCRCGPDEILIKEFLEKENIPFDFFNEPFPEVESMYDNGLGISSRKICADVYIDNKDIHCIGNGGVNWDWIEKQLFEYVHDYRHDNPNSDWSGNY